MIFGAFNHSHINGHSFETAFERLKKNMQFPRTNSFFIKKETFTLGYFLHENLPFAEKDALFFDEKQDILVLMVGSIYNKKELTIKKSRTDVDPKFIAQEFLKSGPGFVEKINGDFSILIYLFKQKRVYLFRDHLGIQPLAYLINEEGFFFSSDIWGLCKAFSKGQKINFEPLLSTVKVTDHLENPNKLVKKLPPGHFLEWKNNRLSVMRYWFPEKIKINKRLLYKEVLFDLDALLKDSIKIRCEEKFNVGAHLSGGIDSSFVAGLARKACPDQKGFFGFSWAPMEFSPKKGKKDEREYVSWIAQHNNIIPVFSNFTIHDFQRYIENFFYNSGYFWEEKNRELALEKGVNLIFNGWGGDEFLSVSDSGLNIDLLLGLNWRLFFKKNRIRHPKKLLRVFIYNILNPYFGFWGLSTKKSFKKLLKYYLPEHKKNNQTSFNHFYKYRSRRERHLGFIKFNHLSERTEQWTIQGFRHGIVYRYPLLDKRIIEYMLQVPSKLLFRKGYTRIVMRDLSKGILPEEIRWNESKLDHVLFEKDSEIINELGESLLSELQAFKQNIDLQGLINFDLFEKDIKASEKQSKEDKETVFRKLIFFKMLHEFTKTYRSLPPESE